MKEESFKIQFKFLALLNYTVYTLEVLLVGVIRSFMDTRHSIHEADFQFSCPEKKSVY